jgi:tyrosine-protein phosphatase YwqE
MSFWPFRRRSSLLQSGLLQGMTDWHCHILPGVDDGVQTLDEALAVLAYYETLGIATVWLTPHIMEDMPNKTADLRVRFEALKAAYHGSVVLHLASENMIDQLFDDRLKAGDLLPLGTDGRQLLVETSYFNPPMQFHRRLEAVKDQGLIPVLAHPERYVYMDMPDYEHLIQMGIRFQLNLVSLTGFYGRPAQKKAELLLRAGFYHLMGTDLHALSPHQRQFSAPLPRRLLPLLHSLS